MAHVTELEADHVANLRAAQVESLMDEKAIELYAGLDLDLIEHVLRAYQPMLSALEGMTDRYRELANGHTQTCGPDHPYTKAMHALAKGLQS